MPKFLYSVITATILSFLLLIFLMFRFSPSNILVMLIFFIALYLFLSLILSLIIFYIKTKGKKSTLIFKKKLYRNNFKYSLKLSAIIVMIIVVRTILKQLW